MTERFTAKDAREIIENSLLDYESVIYDIKTECSKGINYLYWYKIIDRGTKNLLEQDGFTVKITSCQRDGYSTKITW